MLIIGSDKNPSSQGPASGPGRSGGSAVPGPVPGQSFIPETAAQLLSLPLAVHPAIWQILA
ncbi:hypothetical protein N5I32_16285 [Acidimangrovimonas sediminis]|uniref:Uncharacterized protein n=1 Tax=Albidovulum sediminis TaxID=3066345 RepID=A0ABT2NSN7_9RHOB|nr:hypothetical protein [Defluviimonas sediminis]